MTKEHNDECKKLLGLMGIPVVTVSFRYPVRQRFWRASRQAADPY